MKRHGFRGEAEEATAKSQNLDFKNERSSKSRVKNAGPQGKKGLID
jgi:hypothetical protein